MNELQKTTQNEQQVIPIISSEIDTQIQTAKQFPRDVITALRDAKKVATMSESVAESCIYCLERKDKNGKIKKITGASIRMAEIMMQCFGNIHCGTRIERNDGNNIIASAAAWDLEKNNKIICEAARSIRKKDGQKYSIDMQQTTAAAASSIALRNAIFRIIPKAMTEEIYNEVCNFLKPKTKESLLEKINKALGYFKEFGYEENAILEFFDKKTKNDLSNDDLLILRGLATNVKNGLTDINEIFDKNTSDSTVFVTSSDLESKI